MNAEHLVASVVGLHEVRVVGEVPLQALLVRRQAEEPVALGQPLERHVGMVRADRAARGLDDVRALAESLVRAVPALVRAEVDVAVRVRPPDHLLRRADVVGIGRPDEAIRRDQQRVLGVLEEADLLVDELARRSPLVDRRLGDVDRVLVGARSGTACRRPSSDASARSRPRRSPRRGCAGRACCWRRRWPWSGSTGIGRAWERDGTGDRR